MADLIRVCSPTIDAQTKEELCKTLDTGWFGNGPKTAEFEEALAIRLGYKYAVALNSGTSALDLAIRVYKKDSNWQGMELITTPMTFVSDAIVAKWHGMDVTFCDIDEDTLCMDPKVIVLNDNTRVVIPVDSHGRLADIKEIRNKVTKLEDIGPQCPLIIEDAAHAMHTPGVGQSADILMLSFQAVKTLPAGDGGALLTNDEDIYIELNKLKWLNVEKTTWQRAKGNKYTWNYDITRGDGVKAYMNDINATIALGQLRRLDEMMAKRRAIQSVYNEAFKDIEQIKTPVFSYTVQYYTMQCDNRDKLSEDLAEQGVSTSVHFKPLSEMTYWKKAVKRPLPVTDRVWRKLLSLPCHDALTWSEVEYIIKCVKKFYEH